MFNLTNFNQHSLPPLVGGLGWGQITNHMKTKHIFLFAVALFAAYCFTACKPKDEPVITNVYAAGYEYTTKNTVKYWKNGEATTLNAPTNSGRAHALFVADNGDVYVAGYEIMPTDISVAKYWKNGVPVQLTDGTKDAFAYSIFVNGNDVYVAGSESNGTKNMAKYWKNGKAVTLPDNGNDVIVQSIVVKDNTVYMAGNEGKWKTFPVYWTDKNGAVTLSVLADKNINGSANAVGITKAGDVYVAGHQSNGTVLVAKYWKNKMATELTDGKFQACVYGMYIRENDVYICGFEHNGKVSVAKYWKNGTPVTLTDGTHSAVAETIFVTSGGDVYVGGYENNGKNDVAKYWKNGTAVSLTDGNYAAGCYGIAVK